MAWLLTGVARLGAQGWTLERVAVAPQQVYGGIVQDRAGNIFSVYAGNGVVYKTTPDGTVSVFAGGAAGARDGTGMEAGFFLPDCLAIDARDNLYVSDRVDGTIRKITPAGVVTTLAGRSTYHGTADGTGQAALFESPMGIAVDATGYVYVVDANKRIRKISPDGVVTTFAIAPNAVTNPAEVPWMYSSVALTTDGAGNVYAASQLGTVRKYSPAGEMTVLAGSEGQLGCVDGVGTEARFAGTLGIAADAAGRLLVIDYASDVLREIQPDGTTTTVAGRIAHLLSTGELPPIGPIGGRDAPLAFLPQQIVFTPDGSALLSVPRAVQRLRRVSGPVAPLVSRPNIYEDRTPRDLAVGANFTYTAVATGTLPLRYQWYKNGAPLLGATQATLTLPAVTADDAGGYTVTVLNSAGADTPEIGFTLRVSTSTLSGFSKIRETPSGSFLWGITAGGGQLVTVGTQGKIMTSADGKVWVNRASGSSEWLLGAAYGAGKYVVVGDHGTILTSTDGANWRPVAQSGTVQRLNNVLYAAGKFVVVGEAGTILSSTDGEGWTARINPVSRGWLRALTYKEAKPGPAPSTSPKIVISYDDGGGRFYAAGQGGVVLRSADGENWSRELVFGSGLDVESLAEGPIGVGQDGFVAEQRVSSSSRTDYRIVLPGFGVYEPITVYETAPYWQTARTTAGTRFRSILRGAGAVFAAGENGLIVAAPDFKGPWVRLASPTTANLVAGVFYGNTLYIVGENETILASDPLYASRLINISTLGSASPGNPLFSGFVVRGDRPKQVLVRAVGAGLARFGVTNLLYGAQLSLYDSSNRALASNGEWNEARSPGEIDTLMEVARRVGAFPFEYTTGWGSALLLTLAPGAYSAEISARGATSGHVLIEVYDADAISSSGSKTINISTRGRAGVGYGVLTAGFVINGTASRRVMIRGVGPGLTPFGVAGALPQPMLRLLDAQRVAVKTAGAWSAATDRDDLRSAAMLAGAFAFEEGSADSALIATLAPGAYTVELNGAPGTTGAALVEVYDLP